MELNKVIIEEGLSSVYDEGKSVLLSLFPENVEQEVYGGDDSVPVGTETVTKAWQVRVAKPLTRAAAINACEQEAYGLRTAMEVASFGASLARKQRLGEDTEEVEAHDAFIKEVKAELTRLGID